MIPKPTNQHVFEGSCELFRIRHQWWYLFPKDLRGSGSHLFAKNQKTSGSWDFCWICRFFMGNCWPLGGSNLSTVVIDQLKITFLGAEKRTLEFKRLGLILLFFLLLILDIIIFVISSRISGFICTCICPDALNNISSEKNQARLLRNPSHNDHRGLLFEKKGMRDAISESSPDFLRLR